MSKNTWIIIPIIIVFVCGYYIGSLTVKTEYVDKEIIKYISLPTIIDTVEIDKPYYVSVPSKPQYIYKYDTVNNIIAQKVDTSAILADWTLERRYNPVLFDNDTIGKMQLDALVQYNTLSFLSFEFKPKQKQIERITEKTFTPYVGVSYNSLGFVGAGGGLFYKKLGFGLKYITDFERNGIEIELNHKF